MRTYVVRRAKIHEDESGDYTVSEIGRLQTERLADHLLERPAELDAIYTGTNDRHRETAAILSDVFELVADREVPVQELAELDDVPWPRDALRYCFGEGPKQREWVRMWIDGELDLGESPADVRERVLAARRSIVEERSADATVLVVTSVVPLLALTADALDLPIEQIPLPADNTALFEFGWDESDPVRQLNATPHLRENLLTRNGFEALASDADGR